jgi:hypothetical protein
MSYSCDPGQQLQHVAEAMGGHSRACYDYSSD